jgi:Holliday junction resolvase RusA-like endonuclease
MKLTIEGFRKPVSKKNKMRFNRKHGRAYKDKSVREFEDWLFELAEKSVKHWEETYNQGWDKSKTYELDLQVTYATKRKFDIQNCFDTICDALEDVVYDDDTQITTISGSKRYEKGTDKFIITIQSIE